METVAESTHHASVADGIDHQLDPRYVPLQRLKGAIGTLLRGLFFGGAAWIIGTIDGMPPVVATWLYSIAGGVTLAYAIWAQWWPGLSYRRSSYRVDAQGLEIRRGVLWRSVTTVPRSRVQHTDVSQGPFERRYELGTLVVHTAGMAHAVVSVHGLEYQQALRIREHLLPRDAHDVV